MSTSAKHARYHGLNQTTLSILLICLIGFFHLATLRAGHEWGGDFSLYISHARNIAEGRPYGDTGFIQNPSFLRHSPATYPPLFPAILAPVYRLAGLDFTLMKLPVLLFFLLLMLALHCLFRDDLVGWHRIALLFAVGFSPVFWQFKDSIVPDVPFTALLYLTFWVIISAYSKMRSVSSQVRYGVLTGLLIYVTYGLRSAGLVIVPAIWIYELVAKRRLSVFALASTTCWLSGALLQSVFVHSDRSYYEMFTVDAAVPLENGIYYVKILSSLFENGWSRWPRIVLYTIGLAMTVAGFVIKSRSRGTVVEVFAILYMILVLMWSAGIGLRYLLPLVPLYFFYALVTLEYIGRNRTKTSRLVLAVMFFVATGGSYASRYVRTDYGPIEGPVNNRAFQEMCRHIRAETEERDVFIFWNPRVLSLFTRRQAAVYQQTLDSEAIWDFGRQIGATYFLFWKGFGEDVLYLRPVLEHHQESLEKRYSNAEFTLYKITRDTPRGAPGPG